MIKLLKKSKIFFLFYAILLSSIFICFSNFAVSFSGNGEKDNPYVLKDYDDFCELATLTNNGENFENVYFKITNDINFDKTWVGLGSLKSGETDAKYGLNVNPFSGRIDGNDKKLTFAKNSKPLFNYVRDAYIEDVDIFSEYFDGFALVEHYDMDYGPTGKGTNNAKDVIHIENVNLLEGTNVKESGYIGVKNDYAYGIPMRNKIYIEDCTIEKNVNIGVNENKQSNDLNKVASFVGEFVGTIKDCKSYANVFGKNYVGGIASVQSNAMGDCILEENEFYGKIVASGDYVGGIIGAAYNKNISAPNAGHVVLEENLVSKGTKIEGNDYVGGLIGHIFTVQNWKNVITKIIDNVVLCDIKSNKEHIGTFVGLMRSINKYCQIKNNSYSENLQNLKPFGDVEYIDTNKVASGIKDGTTYINTEEGVDNLPVISMGQYGNMNWKKEHNRTDDPLGADITKLCKLYSGNKN